MRKSGILMHISSLPSPYGVGTMGKKARKFVDFLKESGQSYWQILPLSPTGCGDSPYQCFSSYAGNPYFIDLDLLCQDGLLEKHDYMNISWGDNPQLVDYGALYENRMKVLKNAAERVLAANEPAFFEFCRQNAFWLEDYALFMAIKNAMRQLPWTSWDTPLKRREEQALQFAREAYSESVDMHKAVQFLFFRQWKGLRSYANENGILIIGDLPIYVAPDSSDVWANPQWFMLNEELFPTDVAGCPPDSFCEQGQLWGNPLYNWDKLRDNGYRWYISRIAHQFEIYDVLRLDHFRGFDSFYAIPLGDETAQNGHWMKGPGIDFFNTLNYALGDRQYIAEDLGFLTDSVINLLHETGFPGMKVMQFAFENEDDSVYLPHNYERNCVAYTGTHDNDTISGWYSSASPSEAYKAEKYLRISSPEKAPQAMISALFQSVANLAILQAQDLLALSGKGRMNIPGTLFGNWQWRMDEEDLTGEVSGWLYEITKIYGRL